MARSWEQQAFSDLIALRGSSPAWPYRQGLALAVEPTVLALLALEAAKSSESPRYANVQAGTAAATDKAEIREFNASASEWLEKMQLPDGSMPLTQRLLKPGWATAYAILYWNRSAEFTNARDRACRWLLTARGQTFARTEENHRTIGHDPTLVGWPWVGGTHSWVEPTALAILALDREGLSAHARVQQGVKMILDRALDSGGWNYGNKTVFGAELRAQPGPTGIALLALAKHDRSSRKVSLAIDYLRQTLPTIHAPVSLGWGILGLEAHDACPKESGGWLASAYDRTLKRPREAMSLAMLLLAANQQGASLFSSPTQTSLESDHSQFRPLHSTSEPQS